jgi:DNA uptake protein ComE-like DNA-binding protein
MTAPGERSALGVNRWAGKGWLLLTLPFGITTWAAFLYIGIRAKHVSWIVWAAVYLAMMAASFVLDTSSAHPSNSAQGIAAGLVLLAWIGGGAHAFAVSTAAVKRMRSSQDPALVAARDRITLRSEGRHLLATQPELAREVGVGRPDVPGSNDYGLIDVNHCSVAALVRLPGITDDMAKRIVDNRAGAGGFSSVEDVGMLLDLPPSTIDQMRDMALFVPDPTGDSDR